MPEFYRNWIREDAMILWRCFNSWRYSYPAETRFGSFPYRVMLSCGRSLKRNIDKNVLLQLPPKTKDILEKRFQKETFFLPETNLSNKLKNVFIKAWFSGAKLLGMQLEGKEPKKDLEVYSFVKFSTVEEFQQFLVGAYMTLGVLMKIEEKSEDLQKYIIEEEQNKLKEFAMKGVKKINNGR